MKNKILMFGISMVLLVACTTNSRRVEPEQKSSTPFAAYDTARIQGQRDGPSASSSDEGENTADREITTSVRIAVNSDGSLSLDAQNVMIFTTNGMVTLCGPVKSLEEKAAFEAITWQVPGVVQINNQLEVVTQ